MHLGRPHKLIDHLIGVSSADEPPPRSDRGEPREDGAEGCVEGGTHGVLPVPEERRESLGFYGRLTLQADDPAGVVGARQHALHLGLGIDPPIVELGSQLGVVTTGESAVADDVRQGGMLDQMLALCFRQTRRQPREEAHLESASHLRGAFTPYLRLPGAVCRRRAEE